ncbi:MAG: hypothetical protein E7205_06290 [Tissierellaceae bacterium]|jgi:glutaredoxin-related protein|nr:hypothetical protein [Tissierellaceae bacterium]
MEKIILFGSKYCPDCGPAKEFLSGNNVKFAYLDITDSLMNLKRFLKYRDTRPEFNTIKEAGKIGIPCIVINDGEKIIFDYNELKI